MKKSIASLLLCLVLVLNVLPSTALAAGSLSNFTKVNTYTAGQFTDVSDQWFAQNVQMAYEYGLMNGTSATTFSPEKNLTLAEAVKMAACLHSIYNTGKAAFPSVTPWYQPYADYSLQNGILAEPYVNYSADATRSDFAALFACALPDEALAVKNTIADNEIPDVRIDYSYGPAVYKLYRAGILTGDSSGSFNPNSYIQRSEAAAIVTRMANADLRKTVSLTPKELSPTEIAASCSPAVFYIQVYDASGKAYASGSGFFISSTGVAVTNYHVIAGASSAKILTTDDKVYDVSGVYDYSADYDLALLQISGGNFPFLQMGDSSSVVTGQTVYAIGSPEGLDNTFTKGVVSNAARKFSDLPVTFIQFDAAISHGSSGGALLNTKGQVIGVTSAGSKTGQNLNLAVPINLVRELKQASTVPLTSIPASKTGLTVTASQTSVTIAKGGQTTVTVTVSSQDFDSIAWAANDRSIISCSWGDWNGNTIPITIKGLSPGSTTLLIGLLDDKEDVLAVTSVNVTVTQYATSLTLTASQTSVTVAKGSHTTITLTASSDDFDSIAYAKGDTSLISCAWGNWYGNSIPLTITGLAAGSTTLTIALLDAYDNVLAQTTVSVTVTAATNTNLKITAEPSTVTINQGARATVTVKINTYGFDDIYYQIGNESVISCSWGKWGFYSIPLTITGLTAGTTTINITLRDASMSVLAETVVNVTVIGGSTIYYPGYYPVPDWGALTGTPVYEIYANDYYGSTSYYYKMSDVRVTSDVAFNQYIALLVSNGFSFVPIISDDETTVYKNEEWYVFFGLLESSGTLFMRISIHPSTR